MIAALERGEDVRRPDLSAVFAKLDRMQDTGDFDLLELVNLWYGYRDHLDPDVVAQIEQRMLAFKYWFTEPTPPGVRDDKWYWSENHRIIFHACELLVGQAFPDAVFTNDGRTGAEHRAHADALIHRWVDEKARFGFSEWHSDVYYQKDVTPLLTLVEWSDDEAVATEAAMVLDLVLFDVALHLQRGNMGCTHGRSYMKDKSRATDQDVFGLAKVLFDDTSEPYLDKVDPGHVLLARAQRYRVPEVIRRVARSDDVMVDRERMGVPLDPSVPLEDDPEPPYGLAFDESNVDVWWERGAFTAWQGIRLTFATADRHSLWDTELFRPFAALRDVAGGDVEVARSFAQSMAPQLALGVLSEANTYTYRSPQVLLSTVQDHRPGTFSAQVHAWQATIDEHAVVFTTHPKAEPQRGTRWPDSDGYWTGTGTMPRSAQQGTAAIHVYAPAFPMPEGPPLDAFGYLPFTHAWFPTERFDEVVSDGNWTIGRRHGGYVALWSWRPVRWRGHDADVFTNGLTEPFDLVADGGPTNVWVVQVGDDATWGSFEAFRSAVVGAAIEGDESSVRFTSPTEGELAFGATGPFTVDGAAVSLRDHPRFDNPWCSVPFGSTRYEIADGPHGLVLDFADRTRSVR